MFENPRGGGGGGAPLPPPADAHDYCIQVLSNSVLAYFLLRYLDQEQRNDLYGLRVKLPCVITCLST